MVTTGAVVGGSLIYANYDVSFRYAVDKYIPGFAGLADRAADTWVGVVDSIKPKPSYKVGMNKDVGSVIGSRMPSTKKTEAEKSTPPTVASKPAKEKSDAAPPSKEGEPIETFTKEIVPHVVSESPSVHETTASKDVPPTAPSKDSSEEATKDTTDLTVSERVQPSSQVVRVQEEEDLSAVKKENVVESKPDSIPSEIVSSYKWCRLHCCH